MLRLLALALLLANVLYYAWGHELLRGYGVGPVPQTEPQRLSQQIAPEAVQLLSAAEFKRIEDEVKQEQAPKECLQAGPFDATQATALRLTLDQILPADSWVLEESPIGARWIVYMGKYAAPDALAKKRAEVLAMNLKPEGLNNPTLEPGFSLGGFAAKADADAELARLASRGLHTARVVQEREARMAYLLRLPSVGASLKPKVAELRSALGNQALHGCN
jgi:hypothetical protein